MASDTGFQGEPKEGCICPDKMVPDRRAVVGPAAGWVRAAVAVGRADRILPGAADAGKADRALPKAADVAVGEEAAAAADGVAEGTKIKTVLRRYV